MGSSWINIARVGIFRDGQGREQNFTPERLKKIAESYDLKKREAPLVIGHPVTDDPAHGWAKELKFDGKKLSARIDCATAEIKRAVDNGHYRYVSMSLFENDTLKHIGLLGAAAPAIDGLGPVQLADETAVVVTFDFNLSEGDSMDEKDKLIRELEAKIAALTADIARLKAELDEVNKKQAESQSQADKTAQDFAAYKSKSELSILTRRVDDLVAAGKVAPAEKPAILKTAQTLHRAQGHQDFCAAGETPLDDFLKTYDQRSAAPIFQDFAAPAEESAQPSARPSVKKL